MIIFPPFEPDRSVYAPGSSGNVVNCIPVQDGWGPLPDLTVISSALASQCLGACYARTSGGAYRIFAGTATKLYEFNSATLGWTDITRLVGGNYAVPSGDRWSFTVFGANLIAHNIADDIQYINVDSGTNFAILSGSPPKAKYSWVAGEYLCLGNIASFPNRVQTSGIGDASFWTVGQKGCDFQDFPDGEEVMGGKGSQQGAIIFQRTRIRSMTITTGDFSFRTDVLNQDRGVISPLTITEIAPGSYFYYSADGFFLGTDGTPIGRERVDKWFDSIIDRAQLSSIRAMMDPFQKVVWVQAQKPDTSKFLIGYHWGLDRWCYADNNVTEMASLVTPAVTIDGMDLYYATVDDASEPFDSRLFTGGTPTMAVFDSSNRLCYLTGTPRAATLDTADIELNPGLRSFLQKAQVYTNSPTFTLRAITSDYHGGTRTTGNPMSPFPSTALVSFRSPAKIHAFRLEIPDGTDWDHVIGIEPTAVIEGQR
ncbi:hypothetical protein EN866_32945 [Mesorhizobium sp. M2D.F.Ca.ET.223.01.1.1]|uniref:hypothetical protein n=1 Tax=Mesorhizobium sp. M2D.F.Ca.ET.223.01.1.1 TaxID=2563940 RepID=UPI001093072C|nr:hypothetical protein [Mesorhizobium sp. M2D.F.Ca.ET.223.01.1.1]TGR84616.1 hypothetical protein EN866_32945 [Mesorhizobium sp. M2D.F.Ca.ET.223.01.1.1]TGT64499.1 hypothetical protein EN802_32440 [bacterium M00.F.Ca.ET.159.01.1.1]TGT79344.1 hypothetical protein EN800_31780 [bacterium M00.F.Ca.ET.157.01.1.1]